MNRKNGISFLIFIALIAITTWVIFKGTSVEELAAAIRGMHYEYLILAMLTALFFVAAEGIMIWYLLHSFHEKSGLLTCIGYSYIGFFFSGITPSATGGQPMQLYYMKKDGNRLSDSSVVLMTVALVYKLVLVVIGAFILLFERRLLASYLQNYMPLFYLGMFLNTLLVVLLLFVMITPLAARRFIVFAEKILCRIHILKPSAKRGRKINDFVDSYQNAVRFLMAHKWKMLNIVLFTFIQRGSVFFLTYLIYRGFGLEGTGMLTIMALQASVYIAVDMLPLPGAQGITEIMYQSIFAAVFTNGTLTASLLLTRGINFYFVLLVSLVVYMVRFVAEHRVAKKL